MKENPGLQEQYTFRRAQSATDATRLRELFNEIFHPEEVGVFAETIFLKFPGSQKKYWFIAEEAQSKELVSAFTLIPWTLEMEGVQLKVAEMGIVGTREAHRGKGLFSRLSQEFDKVLLEEHFDYAMIQGIPGFYGQFGYHYAVPLENSINLPLHAVPDLPEDIPYTFRLATLEDIPFLMEQDADYRASYSLATYRDEAKWQYLLTDSLKTEMNSEYWIVEGKGSEDKFYCRMPFEGFGTGLILSEISESITTEALLALFGFAKQKAEERDKPYIRLNQHDDSIAGRLAVSLGAKPGQPYAWQIKIPDPIQLLRTISPLLEGRLAASSFAGFSGVFRLQFFKSEVDLGWVGGKVAEVRPAEGKRKYSLRINPEMFPALCLGHRTWQEIRHLHPDTSPGPAGSDLLVDTLFPTGRAWIHEQY